MNYIGFVPVRGGSKSIPGKNIKPFNGKPLVYWVLHALTQVDRVSKVVLATDSDEIEEAVLGLNLPKIEIYRRSAENATDTASTESVMLEYINAKQDDPELENAGFILAQATSPLLQSHDVERGIDLHTNFDSVLSCVRTFRFFWDEDGNATNYDYRNRPRRQDFKGSLMENGAIYISTVENVLQDENRLSGNIGVLEMPEETMVEIDEPIDWKIAEMIMLDLQSKANQ